MRYRLSGNLWGAGFVDVGSVSAQEWNIDWPLGQALGGGLRYVLPVGPIRLDGAYNPGERFAADRSWAVHLSVGFTF
jgi:outer membrane translocation and assembly module TamA